MGGDWLHPLFRGWETLPDGATADAVYIILNASYRDLLNHLEVRPLDYDYRAELAPGPQRLYELLSFPMYGAIANSRGRAKISLFRLLPVCSSDPIF